MHNNKDIKYIYLFICILMNIKSFKSLYELKIYSILYIYTHIKDNNYRIRHLLLNNSCIQTFKI